MQIGYFDESGIDGAHEITLIAGFVARLEHWPKVVGAWKAQLQADGLPFFHYIDCRNQTGPYEGWNWHKDCLPHLTRMADILITSPIGGVSAASLGNWKDTMKEHPDLQVRFPSSYSFCFEMLMHKTRQEMNFHGQPDIAMVFADQRQYKRRALEVWKWHRERNAWPEIKNVTYAEPKDVVGLQMADMLAWETRRHLHKKGDEWRSLPLLSRLIPKQVETGTALYEIAYTGEGLSAIKRATEQFMN